VALPLCANRRHPDGTSNVEVNVKSVSLSLDKIGMWGMNLRPWPEAQVPAIRP
jgi:hypothetical protein